MSHEFIKWHHYHADCYVVPAVHFSHVFALEVNSICSLPQSRPEAIAVELGPQSATAVRNWLGELGVGNESGKGIPVMLGLLKRNKAIRASLRQKAFDLQRETGLDLSEMPSELLLRELEFQGYSLLCLSPIDSIIEAIRCSLELKVPLYGVDLQDIPWGNYQSTLIRDPLSARENLKAYVDTVGHQESNSGDPEIDPRRETVMAARLKGLLSQYRRILFTGGLAHWPNLQRLLANESLRPSFLNPVNVITDDKFERVIVHPVIAASFTDHFPAMIKAYETVRIPVHLSSPGIDGKEEGFSAEATFESLLQRAYRSYFLPKKKRNHVSPWWQDLRDLPLFEDHLMKYSLLSHQLVPDLASTLSTARVMMSRGFFKSLLGNLFNFPWVKPNQYPDYPMLIPTPSEDNDLLSVQLMFNGELRGKRFFISSGIGGVPYANALGLKFDWRMRREKERQLGLSHTWRPWDFLISSLAIRAVEQSQGHYLKKESAPFEHSLLEGLDLKTTLRAYARGEETMFVFDHVQKTYRPDLQPGPGFPVVWILEPGDHKGATFNALYEDCSWMEKYVEDKEALRRVVNQEGHMMIALIGYGHLHFPSEASKKNTDIRSDRYNGILLYQPIHFDKRQFAYWAEWSRYQRNPFSDVGYIDPQDSYGLTSLFEKRLGMSLKDIRWETALILFGLSFAQERMAVIGPRDYQIEAIVYKKAREFGVEVRRVPLSIFTAEELEKMQVNHMTPAREYCPECIFDESVEKTLGEVQTANRDLVPPKWRDFGVGKG
jgi:hypothetical protein